MQTNILRTVRVIFLILLSHSTLIAQNQCFTITTFHTTSLDTARLGDTLIFDFPIENIDILLNHQSITSNKIVLKQLGKNELIIKNCNAGKTEITNFSFFLYTAKKEHQLAYKLIDSYFHDISTFTQGLFYEAGFIYESSGSYGNSFLSKYKLGDTNSIQQEFLAPKYFAEGTVKHKNAIYQLTWKEQVILKYDFQTLKLIDSIALPQELQQGWGLCSDGKYLILSDGTAFLYFIEIVNNQCKIQKKIQTVGHQKIYTALNELEYIDNRIYANILWENNILIINPNSGEVEAIIDLTVLKGNRRLQQVLNGIAKIDNQMLIITGKHWDKLYKIRLSKNKY